MLVSKGLFHSPVAAILFPPPQHITFWTVNIFIKKSKCVNLLAPYDVVVTKISIINKSLVWSVSFALSLSFMKIVYTVKILDSKLQRIDLILIRGFSESWE